MKIPNYDTKSPTQGRSLCKFLDEDFRLLISGQSGCGKTNTVMHILRKPLVYYDKIHFFTPNQHQDKIVDLQKVMKPISKKVGYEVLELHSPEEILDTSEYPSNNRKVVVFDDLVNAPDRIQSKIANHWTDGRHHGISPIYLSQSYYDVPQKIRLNCSHMILYPPATKKHVDLIAKENLVQPNLFNKLGPFEFLFLDKEKKSVAKNFDERILKNSPKMGLFNNVGRYSDVHEYIKNFQQQTQSGLKLDVNNNYDIEGKRLANVGQGVDDDDAVVMQQIASLDTSFETKLTQLKADSLQIDGSSHMTGDLDLRGNKLINPGEIEMNRKLITNLNTDENNDLSAVNMITLKKFHPDVPAHTHEVTKDIDLKELFNVIQSKQRSLNELKTHYDSLVSFEEVNENFLSRQEEFPMQTQLNMNHNSITNLKDPEFGGEAATKTYVDDIETKLLSDVALELIKKIDIGGD